MIIIVTDIDISYDNEWGWTCWEQEDVLIVPDESTAIPVGFVILADDPTPLSPLKPAVPVPAIVVIKLVDIVTLRTRTL